MHKVLICILLAAFALLMLFIFIAEATLSPDATDQLALEAGPDKVLVVELVAVTVAPCPVFCEHPNVDYLPRDAEAEKPYTTNEAAEVEGSRRGPT